VHTEADNPHELPAEPDIEGRLRNIEAIFATNPLETSQKPEELPGVQSSGIPLKKTPSSFELHKLCITNAGSNCLGYPKSLSSI
jgi:hypothetical protein